MRIVVTWMLIYAVVCSVLYNLGYLAGIAFGYGWQVGSVLAGAGFCTLSAALVLLSRFKV